MVHSRKGIDLLVRNMVRVAPVRWNVTDVKERPLQRKILRERYGRGSIAVSKEDKNGMWICAEGLAGIVTLFYARNGSGQQYASLAHNNNHQRHITHIKDNLKEAVEVCTKNGGVLKQLMAIHTVPYVNDGIEVKKPEAPCDGLSKKYDVLIEEVESHMRVVAHEHKIGVDVAIIGDKTDSVELFLHPDSRKTHILK